MILKSNYKYGILQDSKDLEISLKLTTKVQQASSSHMLSITNNLSKTSPAGSNRSRVTQQRQSVRY